MLQKEGSGVDLHKVEGATGFDGGVSAEDKKKKLRSGNTKRMKNISLTSIGEYPRLLAIEQIGEDVEMALNLNNSYCIFIVETG